MSLPFMHKTILSNILEIIDGISKKKIIILGCETHGKVILSLLKSLSVNVEYFIDVSGRDVGKSILKVPVYNIEKLKTENKDNIYIILENNLKVSEQRALEELGFEYIKHYVSVIKKEELNNTTLDTQLFFNKLLGLPKNNLDRRLLVLGDSVMSVLAYQDMNRITLYDMLKNEIEDTSNFTVEGFHYPGFHFGVFYTVLQFLVNTEKLPSIIILPINIRSFSPQWNMNPDYQYEKIIQKINSYLDSIQVSDDGLYGIDKEITYSKFIEYQSLYYRGIRELNSKFISWVNRRPLDENEFSKRYKEIFKWHYMYSLTKDNRKFLLLKKIIQIMKIQDTKILLYITPINYRAGAKYAGDDFIRALNRNLQLIKDYLNEDISANIHFCDFSKTLPETSFTHLNDTTEHLNENGRKLLASLILEKIKTLY